MKNNNHNCQLYNIKKKHQDRVRKLTSKLKCGSSPKQESRRLKAGSQNFSSKNFTAPKNGDLKAKEELKQAHQFLQTIIDYLPVALFVKDATPENFGMIQFCNKACENLFGLTGEQIVGATTYEHYPIAQSHFFNQKDREAIQQGKVLEIPEETFTSQNSGQRILKTLKVPIYDGNNHPQYLLCISEDITERKQVEAALQESEERFQAFMNHSPASTWITDIDGTLLYVNPNWLNLLKLPTQDVIGKNLFEIFPTEIAGQYYENNHLIAETNKVIEFIESAVQKNGDPGHFLVYKFPIQGIKKQAETGLVMTQDITKLKRAEKALQDQAEQEHIITVITHRIRQSLDLQEILETTVAEVREYLQCDRVIIYQFDRDFKGTVIAESVDQKWRSMLSLVIGDCYFQEIYVQLYQQGRVHAVSDIYTAGLSPCHLDLLARFQVRANLAVPIVEDRKLWGLLIAQHCEAPREWQSLEISLLKQLATQVAIAIQQSELYQQAQLEIAQRRQIEATLQQKIKREKLLAATAQRIRQSLDLDEILNTTVMEVRQLLQADRTVIFRFEPDWSGVISVESVTTPDLSILNTTIYDPCFKETYIKQYRQGRTRAIEDIYQANLSQCYLDLLTQFKVRANLVVPILQGEHLWGLLIAHQCTQARQWKPHETELLEQLATQVGIAIAQGQLYEQTRRQAQREQAFNQVIQAIRTSLDLETIFSTATEEVCKLLQAERTVICRYLPEEKLWRNVADFHLSSDLPSALGLEVPDEENEIADRLQQRQVFQIDDASQCAETYNQNYAHIFPGSWLIVPLHFGSVLWGCLSLTRNKKPSSWQAWEIELADAIANQLAIAIQQSELYQQLEQLATLDGLTQIANRRYFDHYLDQEWKRSQREQISLSLLLLDVDHFKLYNDTYGHQAGDECLQKVAKAIRESLKRSSDLVARYGGEEFVVLLPNTKTEGAIQVAQDIHRTIQQLAIEHSRSSVSQFVTVSIGISTTIPKPNSRFEALVSRADQALYEAKRQRNTYRLHRLAF